MGYLIYCTSRMILLLGLGLGLTYPNSLIPPIEGFSASSSSSPNKRRPPRIVRPKRRSTNSSPSDELIVNADNDGRNPNNSNNNIEKEEIRFRRHEQALQDPSLLTNIRFSDRTDLHPTTRTALIDGFGLKTMTHVQAKTYGAAREGKSILARSRTGTGKTLAFLLPTIERLLDLDLDLYRPGRSIGMIVLAPTRELAIQIADQAEILLSFHNKYRQNNKQLNVACIYGGVKMQRDVRLLTGDHHQGNLLPTILVSTPARLLEHLDGNSPLSKNFKSNPHQKQQGEIGWQRRNKSKFADLVAETKIIVLDETDRLLQGSNLYDTQRILSFMARTEKRQTLLFSATFPRQVRRLLLNSSIVKKKKKTDEDEDELLEVDCIDDVDERMDEDANNPNNISATTSPAAEVELSSVSTNQRRVEECYVSLENMSQFIPLLLTILRREQQRDSQNYKILVFFPAGRLVRFLFQFFTMGGRGRDSSSKRNTSQLLADDNDNDIIWEIHSRMSQSSRSRASNAFRNARRGILFSSDVSARGLDYPDVSLVVQMGAPSSEQDYIHRIGRTGRAGKLGRSLLVLLPFEIHHKQERWQKAQRRRLGQSSDDDYIKEDEQLASWLRVQNEEQNGNRNGEEGGKEEEKMRISSVSLFQQCQDDLEPTRLKIRSYHVVLTPSAQAAYISFLAHYIATATTSSPNGNRKNNSSNSRSRSRSKAQNKLQPSKILAYADDFARGTGLASIPELDETFATKLGLH